MKYTTTIKIKNIDDRGKFILITDEDNKTYSHFKDDKYNEWDLDGNNWWETLKQGAEAKLYINKVEKGDRVYHNAYPNIF